MAERTIVGVDFSGAGPDDKVGNTWVTEGLFDGITLRAECCHPVSRKVLEVLLTDLPDTAVAAMDFPFGVPLAFAEYWKTGSSRMPDLWKAAADIEIGDFKSMVDAFKPNHGYELLRVGDLLFPNAQPCLHTGRPNMVPMTFRGMQKLHRLWQTGRFQVPPLASTSQLLPVLLEVMPGAALRNYGLPYNRYKEGPVVAEGSRRKKRETRKFILDNLCMAPDLGLNLSKQIYEMCIDDKGGDALDSLVAATVAARWARCEADFRVPTCDSVTNLKRNPRHKRQASPQAKGMTNLAAAQLEGWIYVPKIKE